MRRSDIRSLMLGELTLFIFPALRFNLSFISSAHDPLVYRPSLLMAALKNP
jgi:hypothetical protein